MATYKADSVSPDVFVGYNSNKFDIPRILKRSRHLGVSTDFSRLLNEEIRFMDVLNESKQKGTIRNTLIDCPGRILFDAGVFVRDTEKHRSYKLKDVAAVNKLPVQKGDVAYEDIWRFYHGTVSFLRSKN